MLKFCILGSPCPPPPRRRAIRRIRGPESSLQSSSSELMVSAVPGGVRDPGDTEEHEQTQTCPVAPQTCLAYLGEHMTHGGYTGKPSPACGPLLRAAPPTLGHMPVLGWPGLPHEVRAPQTPLRSARSPRLGGGTAVIHGPDLPATPPEGAEGKLAASAAPP